jgi:hypothetical protein
MDSLDKFIKRAEKHDAEVDTRLLALEEKKGATAFKSSHRIGDRYREEASGNPYLIVQGRDANLALYSTIDNKYLPLDELCNVCYKFVDNVFDQNNEEKDGLEIGDLYKDIDEGFYIVVQGRDGYLALYDLTDKKFLSRHHVKKLILKFSSNVFKL